MRMPLYPFLCFLSLLNPLLGASPLILSGQEGSVSLLDAHEGFSSAKYLDLRQSPPLCLQSGSSVLWTALPGQRHLSRLDLSLPNAAFEASPIPFTQGSLLWLEKNQQLAVAIQDEAQIRFYTPQGLSLTALDLPGNANHLDLLPSGDLAVILENPSRLCLIDLSQQKISGVFPLAYPAWKVIFSQDGRWAAASHEDQGVVSILDLSGQELARRLVVGDSPRGMALSPDGTVLWVAHQMGTSGGVSAVAVSANAVTATFRLVGETQDLIYIPQNLSMSARLMAAAHIPEAAQPGMLYALSPALDKLLYQNPLDTIPDKFYLDPQEPRTAYTSAALDSPAAQTQTADSRADAPTISQGLLRAGFQGQLRDGRGVLIQNAQGKIEAFNRRGRRYLGTLFADGRYQINSLPWGSYQLVITIEGFHKKVIPKQLLAFTGAQVKNVNLKPLSKSVVNTDFE